MIFFLQAFFPFDHTRHTEAPTQGASKMRRDSINGEVMKLRDLLPLPPSTRYWHWSRQRWKLSILNTTSLPPESIPHQHLFLLSQQCVDGVCDRTRSWTDFLPLADWARPVPIVSAIIRFVLIILICIHLSCIQPRPDGLMMPVSKAGGRLVNMSRIISLIIISNFLTVMTTKMDALLAFMIHNNCWCLIHLSSSWIALKGKRPPQSLLCLKDQGVLKLDWFGWIDEKLLTFEGKMWNVLESDWIGQLSCWLITGGVWCP